MVFKYPLKTMKILENEIKNGTTLACNDINKQIETIASDFAMGNALIYNEIMFYYYVVKPDLSLSPAHQPIEFTSTIKFAKTDCFAQKTGIDPFTIANPASIDAVKLMWQQAIDGNLCTGKDIPYTKFEEISARPNEAA
jgi:hypothetical protein